MHPVIKVLKAQKEGRKIGIYSCCSSNELVLKAALLKGLKTGSYVLIESTANQVNQYGGYTGMRPAEFSGYVLQLADQLGLDREKIILGGDHLGPLTFAGYDEDKAMSEASELIRQYVLAGFTKIHVDTSMKLSSDDPDQRLSDEVIISRGIKLIEVAEEAYGKLKEENPSAAHPVYVVGSEVPIPGGAQQITEMEVTRPQDFINTVETFRSCLHDRNLDEVWPYICAIVVQPGVEEKDEGCTEYDRCKATELMQAIRQYDSLMFEGHSTDYQTRYKLRELVEDGVGILKVGPALTFAMREAAFALAYAEKVKFRNHEEKQSRFIEVLEEAMKENPGNWKKHYHGTGEEIEYKLLYSFSDRCRYYLPDEKVRASFAKLQDNFSEGVPLSLLSQFMPRQYTRVREGKLTNRPEDLIIDHIGDVIDEYMYATRQEEL
ncbi:MAG: class II D-tagatose-bisphosphate aldolase, non-catalytic subunit [Erysipelotrichaceae bacterium]|nr:class II D-tagatose-bisphosphate aldolase, non-catalytic subunit [Erysipelotrichaceae bacterium]